MLHFQTVLSLLQYFVVFRLPVLNMEAVINYLRNVFSLHTLPQCEEFLYVNRYSQRYSLIQHVH